MSHLVKVRSIAHVLRRPERMLQLQLEPQPQYFTSIDPHSDFNLFSSLPIHILHRPILPVLTILSSLTTQTFAEVAFSITAKLCLIMADDFYKQYVTEASFSDRR